MAKLITNQKEFLAEIIDKILPSSSNLYFLVGYFYFSGFEQICRNLEDKKLRILIGMSIEKDLSNKIKEFHIVEELHKSRLQVKKAYYKSLVDVFNDTDFFDSEEKQEAFRIFINKIKNGSLELKKTEHPNHSKLYLFEHTGEFNQGGLYPGTMITGSSNLSLSGMRNRHEINVILRDDYLEGKKIFDDLWDNHSIDIVRADDNTDFFNEVYKKIWIDKLYSPFLFYVRVLIEYFALRKREEIVFPHEITEGQFFNLKYQKDAILQAIEIIEQHNGVLICDVVGLGKSIIASAVAYNLRKKVIIIAPPHLHYQWDREYRTLFGLDAVCFGSGSIDKAIEQLHNVWNDQEVVVIVDEAHKYRSENTENYVLLHRLCQGNKVILLTATPFNNRPQDIFSMIKLFQIPSKSTIRTVANLSLEFQEMIKEYKQINKFRRAEQIDHPGLKLRIKSLAENIRHTLEPVIIRRSRIDIDKIKEYREDLEKQNVKYIFAESPIEKEYYLGDLSDLYLYTLEKINPKKSNANNANQKGKQSYLGARYKPVHYLIDRESFKQILKKDFPHLDPQVLEIAQINLADFMRRLLVGRFESSIFAFQKTLDYMIRSMKVVKNYYEKLEKVPVFKHGYLPDVDVLTKDLSQSDMEDIKNYTFDEELKTQYDKGLFFIPAKDLNDNFIIDIEFDLVLLTNIYNKWFKEGIKTDPKLDNFIREIAEQIENDPSRKIVVFSEYTDTTSYIFNRITETTAIRALYYSSSVSSTSIRKEVRENFDASSPVQKDDYDVIIATDALSEGVNLNRAGTVFNYDIPFNPTRVIQRVGRINRIGKMLFDKIYIYNYFPTDIGEKEIRKKEISTLKKAMIDSLLGEDTRVLTKEEELQAFFHEKYNEALAEQEEESWDTKYREELYYIKQAQPEIIKMAEQIPHRARIRRITEGKDHGVIVFGKKGEDYTFRLGIGEKESESISADKAMSLFKAEISEKPLQVSKRFEGIYQNAKRNMFVSRTHLSSKGPKGEAINKIDVLRETVPNLKDYLNDLFIVMKELNSLPEKVYSFIRNMNEQTLSWDIEQLQKMVPHDYLEKIIRTANRIDEGKETLILAEELTKRLHNNNNTEPTNEV